MKIIEQSVKVLDLASYEDGVNKLRLCEYAGRTCYDSRSKITDESYQRFLTDIIRRGHTSVLEHEKVTLELVTSRDVMAELTRHRIASFSILSQRYVLADRGGDIAFIHPDFYVPKGENLLDAVGYCESRAWEIDMQYAESAYKRDIEAYHMKPEDARKVLPNSAATVIVCTMNLREFLHVYELRSSPRAYPEMRTLMGKIIEAMEKVFPPFWTWGKEANET